MKGKVVGCFVGVILSGIVASRADELPWHPLDREAKRIEEHYLRFGPLWWKPLVEIGGGVDSAPVIFLGLTSQRDTVAVIKGKMSTAWLLGRLAIFELDGSLGYQHYFHFDELRDTPWFWRAGTWLRLGPSALHGVYRAEGSRYIQALEIDLPIRTRWRSGSVDWVMPVGSRWEVQAGYRRDRLEYNLPLGGEEIPNIMFQDRVERAFSGSLTWGRYGYSGASLAYKRTRYDFTHYHQFDASEDTVQMNWRLAPGWRGRADAFIGWTSLRYDNKELDNFQGIVLGGKVDLRLLGKSYTVVSADRRPAFSVFGGAYFIQSQYMLTIGYQVLRTWRLRAGGQWVRLDYRSSLPGVLLPEPQRWRGYTAALDFGTPEGSIYSLVFSWWERREIVRNEFQAQRRWTLMLVSLWE